MQVANLDSRSTQACIKVTDFGNSRLLQGDKQLLKLTSGVGTQRWSSPEIISGCTSYSNKIDVYSFAIVCWEMLHRYHTHSYDIPFSNVAEFDIPNHVLGGGRPSLPPETHPSISRLVSLAWAEDPERRPSFEELLQSFQQTREQDRVTLALKKN